MEREKPIIKSGTRMVVRRPDGLGTARVTSVNDGSMSQLSEIDLKIESSIVRPHSTVQRAHSTVIPRGSKLKNGDSNHIDENYETIISRIGSIQAMDKILKQTQSNAEKDKQSQKQRVGINPNLGNAGVMWESGKRVTDDVPTLLQKRKNSTADMDILPKKSKLTENFDPMALENLSSVISDVSNANRLGEKRRDLDSYTGCIPQHMLHLLPVTQKPSVVQSTCNKMDITQPDLNTMLQQYSTLQAAAGLANNENAKTLFGGLDPSALLQLQLLQVLQRQHTELLKPISV